MVARLSTVSGHVRLEVMIDTEFERKLLEAVAVAAYTRSSVGMLYYSEQRTSGLVVEFECKKE
jgi:hypothetical protein